MEIAERIHRGRKAIALARHKKMDTSDWERYLVQLLEEAGRKPTTDQGLQPWILWEWRRVSIPEWRRVLSVSINKGSKTREEYARWMLRDILLDPDYQEPTT